MEDITDWLNKQAAWIRQTVELYTKNGSIVDEQISQLADICISEVKGEDCSKIKVAEKKLFSLDLGNSFAITSISNIKGVNAIDTNIPLEFSPKGINVVYGSNGSGKSGYIRILKMISGVRYREEIMGNIYKTKKINPECDVTIDEGDTLGKVLHCDLRVAGEHDVLKDIDIFDTKIAYGYVNDENEASFEPWIIGMFSVLGKVAENIKAELVKRNEKIELEEYSIPRELGNVRTVEELKNITYKSKKEDYIKDFTDKDARDLEALKDKTQIEKNEISIRFKKGQIISLNEILNYFRSFESFYSVDSFSDIRRLANEWQIKKAAYDLSKELLKENIDDIDKVGKNNQAWRELWKAARMFYDEVKDQGSIDYTFIGGVCPLCHQQITESVSKRMQSIDEYVNGKISMAEQQARQKYKNALTYPETKKTDDLLGKMGELEIDFKTAIEKVNSYILENEKNISAFKDRIIIIKTVNIAEITDPLNKKIMDIQKEIDQLIKINNATDQEEIIEKIHLLEAKKAIRENEEKVRKNIQKLKEKRFLDEAITRTSTHKITTKSKELAKVLITDAYLFRFNEELKKLSARGLTAQLVEGKGRKGRVPYKVQLRDADGKMISPRNVLSEGESRAVAIAAFFAEAAGRTENCPLIIDDPISSLDYDYEGKVISRLVEAAKKRQVIVFTHRISLVVGIADAMGNKKLFKELSLKSTKDKKGIPSAPNINAGRSDKLLNKLMHENLSKLKRMDEVDEDFNRERHYLCQQFRNCVEKSVEDFLIGAVVMRFRKDVQTMRIRCLPSITQIDCDLVDEMMTKYSAYDHSMSEETPLMEFSISEIEADMQRFAQWIAERKKYIK